MSSQLYSTLYKQIVAKQLYVKITMLRLQNPSVMKQLQFQL